MLLSIPTCSNLQFLSEQNTAQKLQNEEKGRKDVKGDQFHVRFSKDSMVPSKREGINVWKCSAAETSSLFLFVFLTGGLCNTLNSENPDIAIKEE